jgi:hypothetical protein
MVRQETGIIDVSKCKMYGQYYDLTFVWQGQDSDVDYRDMRRDLPIWSIGRHKVTGNIYGALNSFFYLNPDFDCVWLR